MSKLESRNCVVCGKEFNPCMSLQLYCSGECRKENDRIKKRERNKVLSTVGKPTKCKICGREFIKEYSRQVYCSDECKAVGFKQNQQRGDDKARENHSGRERSRIRRGSKEHTKECVVCGNVFTTWNPNRKTCSDECRDENKRLRDGKRHRERDPEEEHVRYILRTYGSEEAYQEHLEEQARLKEESAEQKRIEEEQKKEERKRVQEAKAKERETKKKKHFRIGKCVVCGNEYATYNPAQKTCSKQCSKSLKHAHKHKRIAKEQVVDKDITLEALFKRDSGVCYLCGGECDWSDRDIFTVKDKYPSIDHIIPVSRGGLHSWDNVKLAHFKCNILKRDALPTETEEHDYVRLQRHRLFTE